LLPPSGAGAEPPAAGPRVKPPRLLVSEDLASVPRLPAVRGWAPPRPGQVTRSERRSGVERGPEPNDAGRISRRSCAVRYLDPGKSLQGMLADR